MRTLWAGIRRPQLYCYSNNAHDIVELMEKHRQTVSISEKIVMRAIRKGSQVVGIGMVIVQTNDRDTPIDGRRHEQYLWLAQDWLKSHGLGPEHAILMFEDDADPVPDAPEVWK